MAVTIYGASDDLIEIDGDIRDEFNVYLKRHETQLLAISDGTLLRVTYDDDGIWRLTRIVNGSACCEKVEGDVAEDINDTVILSGVEIYWVVLGKQSAVRKRAKRSE